MLANLAASNSFARASNGVLRGKLASSVRCNQGFTLRLIPTHVSRLRIASIMTGCTADQPGYTARLPSRRYLEGKPYDFRTFALMRERYGSTPILSAPAKSEQWRSRRNERTSYNCGW